MVRAVIVGSVNMDLVVEAERLPRPGETLSGGRFSTAGGGKGANQAVGAARLGASTAMMGAVGKDRFGDIMRSALEKEGIDCGCVAVRNDGATGVALITLLPGGENAIIVAPGANDTVMPSDIQENRSMLTRSDILLVQLELPVETVFEALRIAKAAGVKTILDPAPYKELPEEIWKHVDIAVPNRLELEACTGISGLEDGAVSLLGKGAGAIVVTLGSEGAFFCSHEERVRIPAFPVSSVDSTGAGDAFSAALAVLVAEGHDISEAAVFASAAGALACTVVGAQPGLPRREQVEKFLKENSGQGKERSPEKGGAS